MGDPSIKFSTTINGVTTRTGTTIAGGDGRSSDVPIFVVVGSVSTSTDTNGTTTTILSPQSSTTPGYFQISDRVTGWAATVLASGSNQYALLTVDREVRVLLEKLLTQQVITNRLLATLVPSGADKLAVTDESDL